MHAKFAQYSSVKNKKIITKTIRSHRRLVCLYRIVGGIMWHYCNWGVSETGHWVPAVAKRKGFRLLTLEKTAVE